MLLTRLCKEFNSHKLKYAIAGGFAVALHGAVRGTVDVDLVLDLDEKNLTLCEEILKSMGFVSKIPVDANLILKNREIFIQEKNLIAWSFYNPNNPSEIIDILIHKDLADMNSTIMQHAEIELSVIAKQDLINMKRESGRPQDMEDIKALESLD
jgi:hypothetical protein